MLLKDIAESISIQKDDEAVITRLQSNKIDRKLSRSKLKATVRYVAYLFVLVESICWNWCGSFYVYIK